MIDWAGLRLPGLSADEAKKLLLKASQFKALNPNNPSSSPVVLAPLTSQDVEHVLFKSDEDTHGRVHAGQELPEDFQQDRAERVRWIGVVLARPDVVYFHRHVYDSFIYVCWVSDTERFAVVTTQYSKGVVHLTTAYVIDDSKWEKTKHKLKVVFRA